MMNKTVFGVLLVLALIVFSCSKGEDSAPASSSEPAASAAPAQATAVDGGGFTLTVAKIDFTWNVQGDKMSVNLKAPTKGWVGVGFNPSEEMKDANFIIGFVKDGEVSVMDQHGSAKRNHKKDEMLGGADNVADAAGSETGNTTEISFTLPLKTGDSLDGEIDAQADQVILLAYGKSDRLVQQHVSNARLKVNLSTGSYQVEIVNEK